MSDYKVDISSEEVRNLPLGAFSGKIYIIADSAGMKRALPMIREEHIIGFDTETKPSFRKGNVNKVALVQMATADRAWLFRVSQMGFPDELADILSNSSVMKIGVAVRDDLKALACLRKFQPGNILDLQHLVKEYGIEAMGLRKLMAIVMGVRISKAQQVSNWENPVLTESQILYAATDAWACYEIWKRLMNSTEQ